MTKIAWLGDSIVKGTPYGGVTIANTFAQKVGMARGFAEIINAGIGGDTSGGMLARIGADVIAHAPEICVIECGLNDWLTSVPISTYQNNVAGILNSLETASIKPIGLTKMQRGSTGDFINQKAYLEAFEAQCGLVKVNVIDLFREECASYLYLTASQFYANYVDAVHLSITGHQFVTDLCMRSKFDWWW